MTIRAGGQAVAGGMVNLGIPGGTFSFAER
jgi:hypothetical protein